MLCLNANSDGAAYGLQRAWRAHMRRRQFLTICLARGAWKANDALYGAMMKGPTWLLRSGQTLGVGEVMNLLMQEQAKPVMEAHERLLKRLALYAPLPASVGEDVAEEPMTAAVHARVREMDQRNVKTTLENFKKSFPACVLTKWVMAHPNLLMWGAKHVRFNNHEGKEALGERAQRLVRMAKAVQDRFACAAALPMQQRMPSEESQVRRFMLRELTRCIAELNEAYTAWRTLDVVQRFTECRLRLTGYHEMQRFAAVYHGAYNVAWLEKALQLPGALDLASNTALSLAQRMRTIAQGQWATARIPSLDTGVSMWKAEQEWWTLKTRVVTTRRLAMEMLMLRAQCQVVGGSVDMINENSGLGNSLFNARIAFTASGEWPRQVGAAMERDLRVRLGDRVITPTEAKTTLRKGWQYSLSSFDLNADFLLSVLEHIKVRGLSLAVNQAEVKAWNEALDGLRLKAILFQEEDEARASVGKQRGLYKTYFAFSRKGGLERVVDGLFTTLQGMRYAAPWRATMHVEWSALVRTGSASQALVGRLRFLYANVARLQARIINGRLLCMARSLMTMPTEASVANGAWRRRFEECPHEEFAVCFARATLTLVWPLEPRLQGSLKEWGEFDADCLEQLAAHAEANRMEWEREAALQWLLDTSQPTEPKMRPWLVDLAAWMRVYCTLHGKRVLLPQFEAARLAHP